MRTVNYRDEVIFGIAHELGIDPARDVNKDHAAAWTAFVNRYARQGWEAWDFPEFDVTEERAFRSIWNSAKSFKRAGNNGLPDELFYLPTFLYYRVLKTASQDPPLGTLPTDTNYFEQIALQDRYIDYDQDCRRAVGLVLGVYPENPRTSRLGKNRLFYRPSEKGLDVRETASNSVFLRYQIRPSQFSSVPFDSAKQYKRGDIILWTDGNCYRAVSNTIGNDPTSTFWALVPMPYVLSLFVIYAAASCAAEDVAQKAELMQKAEIALQREIDKLMEQGQRNPRVAIGYRNSRCLVSEWVCGLPASNSSTVTTLTDVCEDSFGVVQVEEASAQIEGGLIALVQDQDYIDIVFSAAKKDSAGNPTSNWDAVELSVEYATDPPPAKIWPTNWAAKTANGGRLYLNSGPPDGNYKLRWKVSAGLLVV